jgi:hypothetical protein
MCSSKLAHLDVPLPPNVTLDDYMKRLESTAMFLEKPPEPELRESAPQQPSLCQRLLPIADNSRFEIIQNGLPWKNNSCHIDAFVHALLPAFDIIQRRDDSHPAAPGLLQLQELLRAIFAKRDPKALIVMRDKQLVEQQVSSKSPIY